GTKKPCPYCSGRLQVPAAPARPAGDPNLNKTLLGECTSGPAPMPVASTAAPMATGVVPPAAQPQDKPAAGLMTGWRRYAVGGLAAVAVLFAVLYFVGKSEQQKWFEAQQQELAKLKAEIEQKTTLLQKQQELEAQQRRQWQEMLAQQDAR